MKGLVFNTALIFFISAFMLSISCSVMNQSGSGGYGTTAGSPGSGNNVNISGMMFSPATLTVGTNTTVTWANHDRTVDEQPFYP